MGTVQRIKLSDGNFMPAFGLGTWKSQPGQVTQAVIDAIDAGYRHIDCAHVYQNEKEVGAAIKQKISDGTIKREDVFVTSKLWNTYHKPELVEVAIKQTLSHLELDYLDMYLVHWPMAYKEGKELFPTGDDGNIIYSKVDIVDTWKAMEEVAKKGYAKSIGLSNFNKRQIETILSIATVKPTNNQIESHPYLNQKKLIDFCKSKDIVVTAYSPLGSPDRPWAKPDDPVLLDDAKLKDIALKYNKSVAQILLRYQIERGVIPIPKSVTKSRIIENFDVFDFSLTPDDIAYMDTFDCNGRICPMSAVLSHPDHPFVNDEY